MNYELTQLFFKALGIDGDFIEYIGSSFPDLSKEKLEAGIFDGNQIRQLMRDRMFCDSMNKL